MELSNKTVHKILPGSEVGGGVRVVKVEEHRGGSGLGVSMEWDLRLVGVGV